MYAATVDGQRLTWEVAAVWRRNMIIRDQQTESLWQHATGEALAGPLAGQQLTLLPATHVTWGVWRQEQPNTSVVASVPWASLAPKPLVEFALRNATRDGLNAPGMQRNDSRLPSYTPIAGLVMAGEARAYPLKMLRAVGLVNDELGGGPVALVFDRAGDRVCAFDRRVDGRVVRLALRDGKLCAEEGPGRWRVDGASLDENAPSLLCLPLSRQRWLGWSEFHPGGDVKKPNPFAT
ncbi:MAG: DUF3179 domain-containing protein [Chloroflexi bacterium]|nr:DUF3179 domain-containing protein [Chloroflexota bacterium]